MPEDDTERGLYPKYEVRKLIPYTDQRGEKSMVPFCDPLDEPFFVLRYSTDLHAWAALSAYAAHCAETHPELSKDLFAELRKYKEGLHGRARQG